MTYTVLHAFGDHQPGDVIQAGNLSEVDAAYLLQTGAIAANDVHKPAARAKTKTAKSED